MNTKRNLFINSNADMMRSKNGFDALKSNLTGKLTKTIKTIPSKKKKVKRAK